jgi:hypothetical protein
MSIKTNKFLKTTKPSDTSKSNKFIIYHLSLESKRVKMPTVVQIVVVTSLVIPDFTKHLVPEKIN